MSHDVLQDEPRSLPASRQARQDRQEGRRTPDSEPLLFPPLQVLGSRRSLVPGARACGGSVMPQAGLRRSWREAGRSSRKVRQDRQEETRGSRRFHGSLVASELASDARWCRALGLRRRYRVRADRFSIRQRRRQAPTLQGPACPVARTAIGNHWPWPKGSR
jgi:hypothetical protein